MTLPPATHFFGLRLMSGREFESVSGFLPSVYVISFLVQSAWLAFARKLFTMLLT